MKRLIGIALTSLLLWGLTPASAKKPFPESSPAGTLAEKLARLDERIERLSRELNYLVWDCYLQYAERGRITPPVMNFPGMSFKTVCDTVPAIASLQRGYRVADSLYTLVLKTDPEYADIRSEYATVRNLPTSDPERRENRKRYDLMYRRLRDTNPDYVPAWERREEAMRVRNTEVTRFLLDYYKEQGREMPTSPMLERYSKEMKALRGECPEIVTRESELDVLRRLRREVYELQLREEFGVPKGDAGTARTSVLD